MLIVNPAWFFLAALMAASAASDEATRLGIWAQAANASTKLRATSARVREVNFAMRKRCFTYANDASIRVYQRASGLCILPEVQGLQTVQRRIHSLFTGFCTVP
jgi:hypothetical protein